MAILPPNRLACRLASLGGVPYLAQNLKLFSAKLEFNNAADFHAFQRRPQENIGMHLKEPDHFPLTAISEDGVETLDNKAAYQAFLDKMKAKGLDYRI